MRGHEEVIALRRAGVRPPMVWVHTDGRYMPDSFWRYLRDCGELGENIEIDPTDNPARADLRWAKGITVNVSGSDELRVGRFAHAFHAAGAARVIASWATLTKRRDGDYDVHEHRFTFTDEELSLWPE